MPAFIFTLIIILLLPSTALAKGSGYDVGTNLFLNSFEVVAGFAAALLAYASARTHRKRSIGKGMTFVAVGMGIMAIGHLILALRRTAKFDPLGFLGESGSVLAFFLAVFASFLASATGFWLIRRSSW
jgi:hydrogenase-4 membrane subunit HyfE